MLSCRDSAVTLDTDDHWRDDGLKKKKKKQERKVKEEEEAVKRSRDSALVSFFATVFPPPPHFPEGPSSARLRACHPFWNMQIADSAFACWCLTFPLEVAHRLNYAPLSAVCLKTPVILPQSATLRQSHSSALRPPRVCLEAVWTRWARLPALGGGGWGASDGEVWHALRHPVFIAPRLGKLSVSISFSRSEGCSVSVTSLPTLSVISGKEPSSRSSGGLLLCSSHRLGN